jgi:hypothetical protein
MTGMGRGDLREQQQRALAAAARAHVCRCCTQRLLLLLLRARGCARRSAIVGALKALPPSPCSDAEPGSPGGSGESGGGGGRVTLLTTTAKSTAPAVDTTGLTLVDNQAVATASTRMLLREWRGRAGRAGAQQLLDLAAVLPRPLPPEVRLPIPLHTRQPRMHAR